MKFSTTVTVKVEAEPTSETWNIWVIDSECNKPDFKEHKDKWYPTYAEAFAALPEEFRDSVTEIFNQPLDKKYKKSSKQYWSGYTDKFYVCISHHYHYEMDFTKHIKF